MSRPFKIIFSIIIFLNILLGSWFFLNNDIFYDTDIARDFLIMDEITQKKIVLIGPRADQEGLFHGPLWHYINFPVFWLFKGNPVAIGWFWTMLTIGFFSLSFWVAKKLFNQKTAWFLVLFLSFYVVIYMRGYSHPFAVMFLMPLLFFLFVRYRERQTLISLTLLLLLIGLMVNLELAAGAPFLILISIYALYRIFKTKQYSHLFAFLILLFPLGNFILFDLRHDFIQTKSAIAYTLGERKPQTMNFIPLIGERLRLISIKGLNFFKYEADDWNIIPSYVLAHFLFMFTKFKKDKYTKKYTSFLFLYLGFYAVSLIHGAAVLPFYWLPLTPLVFVIFFSLIRKSNQKIFYPLLILIFVFNFFYNFRPIKDAEKNIGKHHSSWKLHNNIAGSVFDDAPKTFGYFIYAPDVYGYAEKYAFRFHQMNSVKNAYFAQKHRVTYLVIEPPPKDVPALSVDWWKKNKLRISKNPAKILKHPNGFRIEKYILNNEEIKITAETELSHWLYFR